jgi:hypothetical protein
VVEVLEVAGATDAADESDVRDVADGTDAADATDESDAPDVAVATDAAEVADGANATTPPGGSCNQRHVSAADPAHSSINAPYTAAKPACDASAGSSAAPTPPPSGTAVCRMLIASPRSRSPNQRITARPLEPFTLPPSRPTQHIAATTRSSGGTACALGTIAATITASIAAVATRPVSSTRRSPKRSAAMPHGNSDSATPKPSAPSTRPSAALSR